MWNELHWLYNVSLDTCLARNDNDDDDNENNEYNNSNARFYVQRIFG